MRTDFETSPKSTLADNINTPLTPSPSPESSDKEESKDGNVKIIHKTFAELLEFPSNPIKGYETDFKSELHEYIKQLCLELELPQNDTDEEEVRKFYNRHVKSKSRRDCRDNAISSLKIEEDNEESKDGNVKIIQKCYDPTFAEWLGFPSNPIKGYETDFKSKVDAYNKKLCLDLEFPENDTNEEEVRKFFNRHVKSKSRRDHRDNAISSLKIEEDNEESNDGNVKNIQKYYDPTYADIRFPSDPIKDFEESKNVKIIPKYYDPTYADIRFPSDPTKDFEESKNVKIIPKYYDPTFADMRFPSYPTEGYESDLNSEDDDYIKRLCLNLKVTENYMHHVPSKPTPDCPDGTISSLKLEEGSIFPFCEPLVTPMPTNTKGSKKLARKYNSNLNPTPKIQALVKKNFYYRKRPEEKPRNVDRDSNSLNDNEESKDGNVKIIPKYYDPTFADMRFPSYPTEGYESDLNSEVDDYIKRLCLNLKVTENYMHHVPSKPTPDCPDGTISSLKLEEGSIFPFCEPLVTPTPTNAKGSKKLARKYNSNYKSTPNIQALVKKSFYCRKRPEEKPRNIDRGSNSLSCKILQVLLVFCSFALYVYTVITMQD